MSEQGSPDGGEPAPDPHDLGVRLGLPKDLYSPLATFPRPGWPNHDNFDGIASFWLDRHQSLSAHLEILNKLAIGYLQGTTGSEIFGPRFGRVGNLFIQELHGHHQIEDMHYFPVMRRLDPRLERTFALLDNDHHAIDTHLTALADVANQVLSNLDKPGAASEFGEKLVNQLNALTRALSRHLHDEEDVVIPVFLQFGESGGL